MNGQNSPIVAVQEYVLTPGVEAQFNKMSVHKAIKFASESEFMLQILGKNDFAMKVAMGNKQSVVDCLVNVSAIGLSLNPAMKQAYPVPREGRICFDIGYIGLVDLAVETGIIRWAQSEVVHSGDKFKLCGVDKQPIHEFDPFEDGRDSRPIVGVYVTAKTADGDYLTCHMSTAAINDIRDRSQSWKAFQEKKVKTSPWSTDWSEMAKKTVIKRAYKTWPRGTMNERFARAVDLINSNGEGLAELAQDNPQSTAPSYDVDAMIGAINSAGSTELVDRMWKKAAGILSGAGDVQGQNKVKTAVLRRKAEITGATKK